MFYARTAAIIYVLWGVLHIYSAFLVYKMAQNLDHGMIQGRVFQDAWNLMFFAVFGIVVAIFLNWKNNKAGYWGNLIVVSAGDIGFMVTMIVPGHVPWIPGGLGPLLWVSAAILSTIAIRQNESNNA